MEFNVIFCLFLMMINYAFSQEYKKNIAVIPFRIFYPKETDETITDNDVKYGIELIFSKLYLQLKTQENKELKGFLSIEDKIMYTKNDIASLENQKERDNSLYTKNIYDICLFDADTSSSFVKGKYNKFYRGKDNICEANETFVVYKDIGLKNKELVKLEMLHTTNDTGLCNCSSTINRLGN